MKIIHAINFYLANIFIFLIRIYQFTLSPDKSIFSLRFKGRICAHHPHCSQYSINVLKRYGFWPGIFYAFDRVLHCTPSMTVNYDPDHYKIVFFSSAPIGVPFLQELAKDKRFEIVGVVTQCDKPQGRGMEMCENIIKTCTKNIQEINTIDTVLLLDGFGGDGNSNRFPRLKKSLEQQGIKVYNPRPINTNRPILEEQLTETIKEYKDKLNEKTAIIGHSLGCLLANHFITESGIKIGKLISVAPAFRENNIKQLAEKYPSFQSAKDYLENYQTKEFDTKELENLIGEHLVYLSENDPYVPYHEVKKYYIKHFPKAKIKSFKEKGHFNTAAGISEISELLSEIVYIQTPTKINPEKSEEGKQFHERLKNKEPDFLVVIAYGKIIPENILQVAKIAPINVHGSILPKYRGASPIQSVFLDGQEKSGITIMKMDKGMDTGDMIDIKTTTLKFDRTCKDLIERMKVEGPEFLNDTIRKFGKKILGPVKQDDSKATYCSKIEKEHGEIKLEDTLEDIYNKYRAFYLRPKIYFIHEGKRIIIEELILDENLFQQKKGQARYTKEGELNPAITKLHVKPEGKKVMDRESFTNGYLQ